MAWTKNFLRTPTWPSITIQLVLGTVMLTNAVLSVTRFWAQTVVHRDGLLTVATAAVGGLLVGTGMDMIKHRAAVRHLSGTKAPADD